MYLLHFLVSVVFKDDSNHVKILKVKAFVKKKKAQNYVVHTQAFFSNIYKEVGVDKVEQAEHSIQWQTVVNKVMNCVS
jgi:hypothetical protein